MKDGLLYTTPPTDPDRARARARVDELTVEQHNIRFTREPDTHAKGGLIFALAMAAAATWTWAIFF